MLPELPIPTAKERYLEITSLYGHDPEDWPTDVYAEVYDDAQLRALAHRALSRSCPDC